MKLSILFLTFLLPVVVLAGDGVREINQACVATGCFAGDLEGFPVTISETGSYRLTGNLDVTGEASVVKAIVVTANHVSLDLNGFRILGPRVCTAIGSALDCVPDQDVEGIGIDGATAEGVTVQNGSVVGVRGLGLALGAGGTVRHVNVSFSGFTGILVGQSALVEGCHAIGNRSVGISGQKAVIRGNETFGNGAFGISARDGSVVSGNVIRENGNHGLSTNIGGSTGGNLIVGNSISGNNGFGALLFSNDGYSQNVLTGNGTGLQVTGGVNAGGNVCNGVICP